MSADARIEEYYESLRRGDPLAPFFLESPATVKVGIGERLLGHESVAAGLREQSRTTEDWTVESADLRVETDGDAAWFADAVRMGWDDAPDDRRLQFETRWTGTLVRRDDEWFFATMHVSASVDGDGTVGGVDGVDFDELGADGDDADDDDREAGEGAH